VVEPRRIGTYVVRTVSDANGCSEMWETAGRVCREGAETARDAVEDELRRQLVGFDSRDIAELEL
jgi:hypothetical protein